MSDSTLAAAALDDGTHTARHTRIGGTGRIVLVDEHEALFVVSEGRDIWSLYAVDGPGQVRSPGTVPRPVSGLTRSRDRRRVVANVRDHRADAWMSMVIR
ncbi:MAG TPA: hypothetical protein VFS59_10475 [Gemmatimonadaceae bacterium]|nr:hypothetical protein [Gemmatimonadaceae bacterium]